MQDRGWEWLPHGLCHVIASSKSKWLSELLLPRLCSWHCAAYCKAYYMFCTSGPCTNNSMRATLSICPVSLLLQHIMISLSGVRGLEKYILMRRK